MTFRWAILGTLLCLVCAGLSLPATASPLVVSSYDTYNGNTGTYDYFDYTYSGASPAGNDLITRAPLYGGTGILTNGSPPIYNWSAGQEGVGGSGNWLDISSGDTISFYFASAVHLSSITVWVDNTVGVSPVGQLVLGTPTTVPLGQIPTLSGTYTTYTAPAQAVNSDVGLVTATDYFTINGLNFTGNGVAVQFISGGTGTLMIGQVAFTGTVPEAPNTLLSFSGFALLALRARRRRQQSAV